MIRAALNSHVLTLVEVDHHQAAQHAVLDLIVVHSLDIFVTRALYILGMVSICFITKQKTNKPP